MKNKNCVHCGFEVLESESSLNLSIGIAHRKCNDEFKEECRKEELAYQEYEKREAKRENKLLRRLKRQLKPKIFSLLDYLREDCWINSIEMVTRNSLSGEKRSASDFFGFSVAIRHVYDDTSSCSYSDSYGGYVYLPIGHNRYLKVHISG